MTERFKEMGITDERVRDVIRQQFQCLVKDMFLMHVPPLVSELTEVQSSTNTAAGVASGPVGTPAALDGVSSASIHRLFFFLSFSF